MHASKIIYAKSLFLLLFIAGIDAGLAAPNADSTNSIANGVAPTESLATALSPAEWARVEKCVDRGLAWIATQQSPDGSFPTLPTAQPAVTSLCVMAFLSRGHQPGIGPYGAQLNLAIDYVLSCQKPDGLFSFQTPQPFHVSEGASHTATYNHAISGLMLGEVFGHVTGERSRNVKLALQKAVQYTLDLQTRPKKYPNDKGGWRYLHIPPPGMDSDSDISVTGWQLMFLRSVKNAEFRVAQENIDDAMAYIRRTWDNRTGMFLYEISANQSRPHGRGLMGSAILSLSLGGQHNSPEALAAGDWLLAHPFRSYNDGIGSSDRFFYSTYYCSQAAAQLGGRYWKGIFPPIVTIMLKIQNPDGSFPLETRKDGVFGPQYSTALAILSLTPAYQILPVYQR